MNSRAYLVGHSVARALGLTDSQVNANAEFIGNTALAALAQTTIRDNLLAELVDALEGVIADVDEYERVNNLAPNPGREDCWQSVAAARVVLGQAKEYLGK